MAISSVDEGSVLFNFETGDWRDLPEISFQGHSYGTFNLYAKSENEIYAETAEGTFQFDGAAWTILDIPSLQGEYSYFGNQVLVGQAGELVVSSADSLWVRRDDGWSVLTSFPDCPTKSVLPMVRNLWGTGADDLYASVTCFCNPKINPDCWGDNSSGDWLLYWNGAQWTVADKDNGRSRLSVIAPGEAYALSPFTGEESAPRPLRHYVQGVSRACPDAPEGEFHTIAAASDGTLLLGGTPNDDSSTLRVAVYREGAWKTYDDEHGGQPAASLILGDGRYLIGEESGRLMLLEVAGGGEQAKWTAFNGAVIERFRTLHASATLGMMAGGSGGYVWSQSGGDWTHQYLGDGIDIVGISSTAGGTAVVGGKLIKDKYASFVEPSLWCTPKGESLAEVDLSQVPGDEAVELAWANDRCNWVTSVAAAPDAEILYALCDNGWLLTLTACSLSAAERLDSYSTWSIAAFDEDELFVLNPDGILHRKLGTWSSIQPKTQILDIWRVPDTGELVALASDSLFLRSAEKLTLVKNLPMTDGMAIAGTSREDFYVLGDYRNSGFDTVFILGHFDGEQWQWTDVHTIKNQNLIAATSSGELFATNSDGSLYQACKELF